MKINNNLQKNNNYLKSTSKETNIYFANNISLNNDISSKNKLKSKNNKNNQKNFVQHDLETISEKSVTSSNVTSIINENKGNDNSNQNKLNNISYLAKEEIPTNMINQENILLEKENNILKLNIRILNEKIQLNLNNLNQMRNINKKNKVTIENNVNEILELKNKILKKDELIKNYENKIKKLNEIILNNKNLLIQKENIITDLKKRLENNYLTYSKKINKINHHFCDNYNNTMKVIYNENNDIIYGNKATEQNSSNLNKKFNSFNNSNILDINVNLNSAPKIKKYEKNISQLTYSNSSNNSNNNTDIKLKKFLKKFKFNKSGKFLDSNKNSRNNFSKNLEYNITNHTNNSSSHIVSKTINKILTRPKIKKIIAYDTKNQINLDNKIDVNSKINNIDKKIEAINKNKNRLLFKLKNKELFALNKKSSTSPVSKLQCLKNNTPNNHEKSLLYNYNMLLPKNYGNNSNFKNLKNNCRRFRNPVKKTITIFTRRKRNEINNFNYFTQNFHTNTPIYNDKYNSFKELFQGDNFTFNNEGIYPNINKTSIQNFETNYE